MKSAPIYLLFMAFQASLAQYTENDWPSRDTWMQPERILELAQIGPGDKVADIGCHEGYMSMHLARTVAQGGIVFAVDIREDRLKRLAANASERRLENIVTVLGRENDPLLPENGLDAVFIVDTYHEMEAYMEVLGHVRNALKPGGRIIILEKLKDYARNKSRDEQTDYHTLSPEYVREELMAAGFQMMKEVNDLGNWENDPDKKIWVLLAKVPDL